ncbi:GPI transamidase component PIG-T [Agrilus planipennis]|uniref:GPI transamidase component PIG-T n=1 Tax=Agrilus planipennis TaxID=224129 RepID=A0A1W4XUV2_AGRPL|nr:GPI transamidase component PIG-T [Agrilus planipennis]
MCLLFFVSYYISVVLCSSEHFTEELLIKPLHSEQVYTHFHFVTKWDSDPNTENFRHTNIFSRAIGEIIHRYNVQELHLSLTTGLWRYESWGYPVVNAGPGAELWVWFKPDTVNVDDKWKFLTNALSGLICASLNFIDKTNSVSPKYSFKPSGLVREPINSTFLRYASLPKEHACTENLTPWKKLLPCKGRTGLGSLLNAGYIHNTRYHSLSIAIRTVCRDESCTVPSLILEQTVGLTYDYQMLGTRNWSIRRLFGQGILGPCPLAESTTVYVDTGSNFSIPFSLSPSPNEWLTSLRGGQEGRFAKYTITYKPISIASSYNDKQNVLLKSPPPLFASQYFTYYGQEKGGLNVKIHNNHWASLDVVVLQNIPWIMPLFLHTLSMKTNGKENKPLKLFYMPGKMRERPTHFEYVLRLPAKSVTIISVEFRYTFLKWTEYPPDANHGIYIPPAVISALLPLARNITSLPQDGVTFSDSFNASRSSYLVQIRTESVIITLPTPDFSMPYNAICLACTVVALAFGPLHNITTKRLGRKTKDKERLLTKIKRKLKNVFCKKTINRELNSEEDEKTNESIVKEFNSVCENVEKETKKER